MANRQGHVRGDGAQFGDDGQFRIEGRTSANLGSLANKIRLSTIGTATTLGIFSGTTGLVPVWNKNIELVAGNATILKEGGQPSALAGTPYDTTGAAS